MAKNAEKMDGFMRWLKQRVSESIEQTLCHVTSQSGQTHENLLYERWLLECGGKLPYAMPIKNDSLAWRLENRRLVAISDSNTFARGSQSRQRFDDESSSYDPRIAHPLSVHEEKILQF